MSLHRAGKRLLSIAAFAAGLVAGAAVVQKLAPALRVPEYTEKLEFFAAHRDRIDTLFIGSSRVRRQISPQLFDAATAELGKPTHSFNLGLDGMTHPELPYIVERVLALEPRGLQHVVLELTGLRREFNRAFPQDSLRAIHWHTYEYTAMACRAIWRDPAARSIPARLSMMGPHLLVCAQREWNPGGSALLWQKKNSGPEGKVLGPYGTGFFPVPERFPAAKLAAYQRDLAALAGRVDAPPFHDPVFEEATDEMIARLRERGIQVTVVVMPCIYPKPPWVPEFEGAVLRFDDPAKDAELFDPVNRYDAQHLNAEGAKVFTRELARRFVRAHAGR